jgi:hypothetical protein
VTIHTTPGWGLAYVDADTPLSQLATASQSMAQTVDDALTAGAGPVPPPPLRGKTGQRYRMLLGTIRNYGSANGYWQPIDDAAHNPTGIESVTTSGTEILVDYDFDGNGIGTVLVTTDETMAAERFFAGASVAANQCSIKLARAKELRDYCSFTGVVAGTNPTGFTFANGVFTPVSYTAGVLTVSHPTIYSRAGDPMVTPRGNCRPVISSAGTPATATQTKVELWNPSTNVLLTAGDSSMKFYLSRADEAGFTIDPRSAIDTTTAPNHNLWIWGVHEVP